MTREELFTKLKDGARWDVGVAINRSNSLPLDANSIFDSLEAAQAYAKKDAAKLAELGLLNNAYIGQIITVIPAEGDIGVYYIDTDQTLKQVGKSIAADEASIVVENDTIKIYGFKDAAASTYPRKSADGKIEWVTIQQLIEGATENTITVGDNKTVDSAKTETGYTVSLHGADKASENQVPALDADKNLKWISVYTKDEVDAKIAGVFSYKGKAAGAPTNDNKDILVDAETIAASSGNIGYVYIYNGREYVSNGEIWEELGFELDLSGYYTKAEVGSAIDADVKVEADRAAAAEKALDNRVTALEAFDHSTYAVKTDVDAAIAAVDDKVDANADKITALEEKANTQDGSIKTLNTELSKKLNTSTYESYASERRLTDTEVNEKVAAVDGRVDTLNSTVTSQGTAITKAQAAADGAQGSADAVAARVTTAEGEITTLKTQIGGLTGAMHFRGTSTTLPTSESGATVEGVDSYAAGDVVLYGNQEYVYDGKTWHLFGDEGSYALKDQVYTKTEVNNLLAWQNME